MRMVRVRRNEDGESETKVQYVGRGKSEREGALVNEDREE